MGPAIEAKLSKKATTSEVLFTKVGVKEVFKPTKMMKNFLAGGMCHVPYLWFDRRCLGEFFLCTVLHRATHQGPNASKPSCEGPSRYAIEER